MRIMVTDKQKKNAMRYLEKAQSKFLNHPQQKKDFSIGEKVLIDYSLRRSKKKAFGKSYFPYSGEIIDILRNGSYYKIRWGLSVPPKKKSGEIEKKLLRWDQLIPQTEGEVEELVVQQLLRADSYNTSSYLHHEDNLEEILRDRMNGNDLEILCAWNSTKTPSWKKVCYVGNWEQYRNYLETKEYFEELRRQGRLEETISEEYAIERFFFKREREVFVLWKNFVEPGFIIVQLVKHLDSYKNWKLSRDGDIWETSEEELQDDDDWFTNNEVSEVEENTVEGNENEQNIDEVNNESEE